MKKYKVICLVLIALFLYTPTVGYAFLGEIIGKSIPQPVYDTPMGMNLEKMAKTVQQLNYLYDSVQKLDRVIEGDMNNSSLINLVMGTEDLIDVVAKKDLHKMSKEELEQYVARDLTSLFTGVNRLSVRLDTRLQKIEDNLYLEKVTKDVIKNSKEIQKARSKAKDEEIPEDINKENKSFDESQKDIVEYYDDKIEKMAGNKKVYDKNSVGEGTVNHYIKEQNDNIKKTDDMLVDKGNNMTVQTSINYNSKLIMELHKTQLEILNALATLNDQVRDISEIYIKENMEKDLIDDQREYGKR